MSVLLSSRGGEGVTYITLVITGTNVPDYILYDQI